MLKLLLITGVIAIVGCSDYNDQGDTISVKDFKPFRTTCLDGVRYYGSGHKLSPAWNPDGTLQLCSMEDLK